MANKKQLTEDEVFKILKQFVIDEVHEGDFDQGQDLEDTIKVAKTWWNKYKNRYETNQED